MATHPTLGPGSTFTSTEAFRYLLSRFNEFSERLSHFSASIDTIRHAFSKLAELSGRVTAMFIAQIGLPRLFHGGLYHALAHEAVLRGGSKGPGSAATAAQAMTGGFGGGYLSS